MKVVAIIQARMTSTRLPGKVLTDICGKPALQRMLERVKACKTLDEIVVATTTNATDDPVVEACQKFGVTTFRGDEFDVLGRFWDAAEASGGDAFVRLTADCPMIDPAVIDAVVEKFLTMEYDYVSNTEERTYPDGLDTEVFTAEALRISHEKAKSKFAREHVTPYMRGKSPEDGVSDFKRGQVVFEADFSHVRWTLDTAEDLERIRELVGFLPESYTWLEALSVASQKPWLLGTQVSDRS